MVFKCHRAARQHRKVAAHNDYSPFTIYYSLPSSVSRGRRAAQRWVKGDLVEGGDEHGLGLGVARGEQVELRHLARQHAELEEFVPDGGRPCNLLAGLSERAHGVAQGADVRRAVAARGEG